MWIGTDSRQPVYVVSLCYYVPKAYIPNSGVLKRVHPQHKNFRCNFRVQRCKDVSSKLFISFLLVEISGLETGVATGVEGSGGQ